MKYLGTKNHEKSIVTKDDIPVSYDDTELRTKYNEAISKVDELTTRLNTLVLPQKRVYNLSFNSSRCRIAGNGESSRYQMLVYGEAVFIKLDFYWTSTNGGGQFMTLPPEAPLISGITEVQVEGGGSIYISERSRSIVALNLQKDRRYIVTLTNFL